jgi:hypothetical protein
MKAQDPATTPPQPAQAISRQPIPWDPYRIFAFVFIVSTFVVGIILGLNWARLGKPNWVYRTIFLSLAIGFLAVAATIGWIALFLALPNVPQPIILGVPFISMGVNFGFTSALARLQHGAYRKWKTGGDPALASYGYDFRGATALGSLIALAIFVGGTFFIPRMPLPSIAPSPFQPEETFPEIQRVPLIEAKSAFDSRAALFLDVRSSSQFSAGHIPEALSIPLISLEDALADLDPSQWIITYCT